MLYNKPLLCFLILVIFQLLEKTRVKARLSKDLRNITKPSPLCHKTLPVVPQTSPRCATNFFLESLQDKRFGVLEQTG